jgi:hypothetical protein
MFIATALSLRGEDIFLSSSPQEAAHLIAKLQAGICRGQRATGKRSPTRSFSSFCSGARRRTRAKRLNSRSAAKNKNNRQQKDQEGTAKCPISGSI